MTGYWMKPQFYNGVQGGDLILGPVQFNWFSGGFRVHLTWPRYRTWELRRSKTVRS